jgi:hypothetical protein
MDELSDSAETLGTGGVPPKREITGDAEAWLKMQLATLVSTAIAIHRQQSVAGESRLIRQAIDGAINGAADEICGILYVQPCYVNLRPDKTVVGPSVERR